MLLFLGAGASKPFGIPDMKELTEIVIKELKSRNKPTWMIEDIKTRVENFNIKPDIESILTCVDALNNPELGVKNAGAFAAYLSRFTKPKELYYGKNKDFYKNISEEIREIIKDHCFLPKDDNKIKTIIDTYDRFFKFLNIEFLHGLNVFTTNYDYCFETYCSEKQINFFDGFIIPKNGIQTFIGMENTHEEVNICKLHGSSNYVINDRNTIIKTDHIIKPGSRITGGRIAKEAMVFPTNEKYFSNDPYFSLLNKLRNELISGIKRRQDRIIVIIGYSFRDHTINNAFIDATKKPAFKNKRIFLIDPFAKDIIKNNISELSDFIEPINHKFEKIEHPNLFKVLNFADKPILS